MYLLDVALAALDPTTHQAYITTGGAIIIAILAPTLPVIIGQNWRNGRRSKRAAEQSTKAAEQTSKVGNGYAKRTEETLARIEKALDLQGADLRTLTNRFNKHIDKEN